MINDALSEHTLAAYLSRRWQSGEIQWGRAAIIRGWRAAEGKACPYLDHRTDGGQVTFSRGYARRWREGRDARAAWERVGRNPQKVGA